MFTTAPQTITLTTAGDGTAGPSDFGINSNITIIGPSGSNGLTLSNTGVTQRFFYVGLTGSLTLQNLTLSGGKAQGGTGFFGGGAAGMGGAIFNQGTLNLVQSTLSGNATQGGSPKSAVGRDAGGGLGGNAVGGAGGGPNGGAIPGGNGGFGGGGGAASLNGGNGGFGGGGGTGGNGGNGGFGGGGGGGYPFSNGAAGYGGEGGLRLVAGGRGGGGAGMGGAIFNAAGTLTITNSTLAGNSATGGGAASGLGGAIFNLNGALTLVNDTLANNTVAGGIAGGSANGGALFTLGLNGVRASAVTGQTATIGTAAGANVTATNTIFANSIGGTDIVNNNSTVNGSHNLATSASGVSAGVLTATTSAALILAPLYNNGGPTATIGLRNGSVAIDAGADTSQAPYNLSTDQRGVGFGRNLTNGVDIGAFEFPALHSNYYVVTSLAEGISVPTANGHAGTQADPYPVSTLRGAVMAANRDFHGADTITFDPSLFTSAPGTITLSTAAGGFNDYNDADGTDNTAGPSDFGIVGTLTIIGPGGDNGVTLTNANAISQRLFYVGTLAGLTLKNLTLSGGKVQGGAGSGGGAGMGGAVFNQGSLQLIQSTLSGNTARGGDGAYANNGGAPNGSTSLWVSGGFGSGGAAGGKGGFGGGDGGTASKSYDYYYDSGGGYHPPRDIKGIPGNGGWGMGGAVFNAAGKTTITNSTLTANIAQGGSTAGASADNGSGLGGAVFNLNGSLDVINSTLAANSVAAGTGGVLGTADGSGLFTLGQDDTGVGAAAGAKALLVNNLFADSSGAYNGIVSNNTTINQSSGANLATINAGNVPSGVTPDSWARLKLGVLTTANGGPTATMLPATGSDAIDNGADTSADPYNLTTDQRGYTPRKFGTKVDIGAVEIGASAPGSATASLSVTAANPVDLGTTTTGTAGTPATFSVSGSNLSANVSVTPPTGVELSSDNVTFSPSLTLTPTAGALASTTIYARITSTASLGGITGQIAVTSSGATEQDVNVSGTVNAAQTGPTLGTLSTAAWTVNKSGYTGSIPITGTGPFSIGSQSGLPTGLQATINGSNIIFTGVPASAGPFSNVHLSVTDGNNKTGGGTFSITINAAPTLGTLSPTQWPVSQSGYTGAIPISDGTGPFIVSAQTGLPDGLAATITNSNITFTGTPASAGTFNNVQLTVQDAAGATVSGKYTITVLAVPTVTTPTSASIATTSATLGGTVTSDGGAGISARGVVVSLTSANDSPTLGGTGVTNLPATGTTGTFTVDATNLQEAKGYSYAAYATNSQGTTYSSIDTFSTLAANHPPVITSDGGGDTANKNVAENTIAVTTVTATDPDDNTTFTYSLSGTDAALFSIDAKGVLTFKTAPDFENPADANTDNVYLVTVQVSDGLLTDTQALSVTVTDVNEPPSITSDGGGDTANKNVAENTIAVTTVTATDPDDNTTFTYSLSGTDAALFSIDAKGVLTFKTAPDFENPADANTDNVYLVTVQVSDGLLTDTQALSVTVTDVNEPPSITSDGGGDTANKNVAENTTAVTKVTATDPDASTTFIYSLSGVDAALFNVDSAGALTFKTAPDFETPADANFDNVYLVTVQVSDGLLSDTQALSVTVTDVNEPPSITSNGGGQSAKVNVPENTTSVTTVIATDPDKGQTLTYSISGGDDASKFSISNGVLSFKAAPDFENPTDVNHDNVYLVSVQASDGHGGTVTQDLKVTVADVAEVTPNRSPVAHDDTATTPNGKSVTLNVLANDTDPDHDPLTIVGIVSGPANGKAVISGNKILYTPNFRFHDTDSLIYRISDGHGGFSTAKATITVIAGVATAKDPLNSSKTAIDVLGTGGNDNITVKAVSGGKLQILLNGASQGDFALPGHLFISAGGGNDFVTIDSSLAVPAVIDGGEGNDIIKGGGGDDSIFGGDGRDLLIGSSGSDYLNGGNGDDILISGVTRYDTNPAALADLLKEWSRTDATYAARVNAIRTGNGQTNGRQLNATTVVSSATDPDTMVGAGNSDLFYWNPKKINGKGDIIRDAQSGEVVVSVNG